MEKQPFQIKIDKWKPMILAIIMAGIIVFVIGLYYEFIKAGIPYQDAPLELQIKYAINYGIGETLTKTGFIIVACGGISCLLLKWISKVKSK